METNRNDLWQDMFDHLPHDLLLEIFSRLMTQDICECKFVCKNWHKNWFNLVSDPIFHELHSSKSIQSPPNCLVFCHSYLDCSRFYWTYHNENSLDTSFKLRLSANIQNKRVEIVGSSNGLLCLAVQYELGELFYICNPLTGEVLELPRAKTQCQLTQWPTRSGFAFDATSSTYKVIRTWWNADMLYNSVERSTAVEIFTLGSGAWRRIKDVPGISFSGGKASPVSLNGALHWLTRSRNYNSDTSDIALINISAESFQIFPFSIRSRNRPEFSFLCLLRGCLAVIDSDEKYFNIWIMKEYGVQTSWGKKYCIPKKRFGTVDPGGYYFNTVREMSDGRVLIQFQNDQGYYDIDNKKYTPITFEGMSVLPDYDFEEVDAAVLVMSFISPKYISCNVQSLY